MPIQPAAIRAPKAIVNEAKNQILGSKRQRIRFEAKMCGLGSGTHFAFVFVPSAQKPLSVPLSCAQESALILRVECEGRFANGARRKGSEVTHMSTATVLTIPGM